MEKLVITVTCDTTLTYPHNPHGPKPDNPRGVADEYVRAINAGASICHVHGSYISDTEIQPDGRLLQIPHMDGWAEITERIRATGKAVVQFGLASIRLEQKVELWQQLKPDMSSINFDSHDEYFQPVPEHPPAGYCYSIHPIPSCGNTPGWPMRTTSNWKSNASAPAPSGPLRKCARANSGSATNARMSWICCSIRFGRPCSSAGRAKVGRRHPPKAFNSWSITCRTI